MNYFYLVVLITLTGIFGSALADPVSQGLADFSKKSLTEWAAQESSLKLQGVATVSVPEVSMLSMAGSLSNIEIFGIGPTTQISTTVLESVGLARYGQGLEYHVTIRNPIIVGNYSLTGSLASAVPIAGTGLFEIRLEEPIVFYCKVPMHSEGGFVKLDQECSKTEEEFSMDRAVVNFPGLIPQPGPIDAELSLEIQEAIAAAARRDLWTMTLQRVPTLTKSYLQMKLDETKLLDMVSPTAKSSYSRNAKPRKPLKNRTPINDPIVAFTLETLQTVGQDPLYVGGTIDLDMEKSVLLPLNGTLTDIKFSGFSDFAYMSVNSDWNSYYGLLLEIELQMKNISLTGRYSVNGSVAGDIPIRGTGLWSISSVGMCNVRLGLGFKNKDGFLTLDKVADSNFECDMPDYYHAQFPGLLDNANLTPEVYQVAIDSLGRTAGYSWTLNTLLKPVFESVVIPKLQQRFDVVPIIGIITNAN